MVLTIPCRNRTCTAVTCSYRQGNPSLPKSLLSMKNEEFLGAKYTVGMLTYCFSAKKRLGTEHCTLPALQEKSSHLLLIFLPAKKYKEMLEYKNLYLWLQRQGQHICTQAKVCKSHNTVQCVTCENLTSKCLDMPHIFSELLLGVQMRRMRCTRTWVEGSQMRGTIKLPTTILNTCLTDY